MTYRQVLHYLHSYIPSGDAKWNKNFGLEKFKFLLQKLDNPHLGMKYIHVGGTAGKGSTATFVSSILSKSGYKTGLHLSPHTITIRERAQINGLNISKNDFIAIISDMQPLIDNMEKDYGTPSSFFEILLALSFIYFKKENCDISVIEVGLGGRLDASNVIDCHYQIITNIGLDHTKILGNTKELILKDKQEIIKINSTVTSGIQEKYLKKIILEKVENTKSTISFLNQEFKYYNVSEREKLTYFDYRNNKKYIEISNIELKLPGLFQVENACLAITAALNVKQEYPKITNESIKEGLSCAYIPGRLQVVSSFPLKIIDGAHNPDKFKKLLESLNYLYPKQKFVTVLRFKRRKDFKNTLKELKKISELVIITGSNRLGDMGWDEVYNNEEEREFTKISKIRTEPNLKLAIQQATQYQKENNVGLLITGSIYMIKESLKYI